VSLVKEVPPNIARGRTGGGRYSDIAEKLKADPGEWYRIGENLKTSQLASGINNKKLVDFRTDEGYFEAVSRSVNDGTSVWARYVPPAEDEDGGDDGRTDFESAGIEDEPGTAGALAE
jgi:hypothetical protein